MSHCQRLDTDLLSGTGPKPLSGITPYSIARIEFEPFTLHMPSCACVGETPAVLFSLSFIYWQGLSLASYTDWPETQVTACLCFDSAGITSSCNRAQLFNFFFLNLALVLGIKLGSWSTFPTGPSPHSLLTLCPTEVYPVSTSLKMTDCTTEFDHLISKVAKPPASH